jgi:type II secretory pathway pseudopilin PulG
MNIQRARHTVCDLLFAARPGRSGLNTGNSPSLKSGRRHFTLIELLIVIGLLGALATLILPRLTATRTEAMDPIVQTEMQDIRRAFQRFYNDVMPNDDQLELFRLYGLAPLMANELTGAYTNDDSDDDLIKWDDDKQRGWRGPYLDPEGTRYIENADTVAGQNDPGDSTDIQIPVILDPYSKTDKDARYYRVLCRHDNGSPSTTWLYNDLALVFVGIENHDPEIDFDTTLLDSSPQNGGTPSSWQDKYDISDGEEDQELVKKLVIDVE